MIQKQGKTEEMDTRVEVLKKLDRLGLEWYEADLEGNNAEKQELQTKIFEVLSKDFFHEDQKMAGKGTYEGNPLLNAAGEFILRDLEKFKPEKDGAENRFSSFLLSRLNYRSQDILRKDLNIRRKNKKSEKESEKSDNVYEISLNEINTQYEQDGKGGDILRRSQSQNSYKNPMELCIEEESFCEIIMLISKLQESLKGRQNNDTKRNYFKLFSTEHITHAVRIFPENLAIRKHERDIFNALKKSFLNYYMRNECHNIKEIENGEMKRHSEVEEGATDEREIEFPFSRKLYITYLDRVENNKIKDAAISMQYTSYKDLLGELLNKR